MLADQGNAPCMTNRVTVCVARENLQRSRYRLFFIINTLR